MTHDFQTLFRAIFAKNALDHFCDAKTVEMFEHFTELLQEENARTNLTAIRDLPNIISKHYADCLLAASLFPLNATVLDLGCGGGFPTIPLAITRPDLRITALDSTAKKLRFVEKATTALSLTNVKPICSRAEDPSLSPLRETFDIVTSRAMARMNVLCELALPFVKIRGNMIALKGAQGAEEFEEAKRCIRLLGGRSEKDISLALQTDSEAESRHFLIVSKEKPSPAQYPRSYAVIAKKPL